MRIDDYEVLLKCGFDKFGTDFYQRDNVRSCCEYYQYAVDIDRFKSSESQKKALKRFYRYLNEGKVNHAKEEKKEVPIDVGIDGLKD